MRTSLAPCKRRSANKMFNLVVSRHDDAHGFVQDTPAGCLSRFRQDGGVPILLDLTNIAFQSFEDTSSNKANNISSSTVAAETRSFGDDSGEDLLGFDTLWEMAIPYEPHRGDHTTVSSPLLLQRSRGVPLLEVPLDRDAFFRPLRDTSSDDANKIPSATVDWKRHASGDDGAVGELPVFHRDGWDAMGDDHVDLALYMYRDA